MHDMDGYRAWREDDKLFGLAILNCRGPLSIWLIAAKAIQEAGVRLKGDLVLTAVVGETGAAQIEEYQGPQYLGKGIGTRTAIAYGPHVDYAMVGETTDFGISWVECSVAYVKINVAGESIYTPRTRPKAGAPLTENPSAIVKMAQVVQALNEWAATYPDRHGIQSPCGPVRPKVNIGAIRGGSPCRPSETAASCSIYMDMWRAPGASQREVLDELRGVLDASGVPATMQVYMQRNGFIGKGVEPLADAVTAAHREVTGSDAAAGVRRHHQHVARHQRLQRVRYPGADLWAHPLQDGAPQAPDGQQVPDHRPVSDHPGHGGWQPRSTPRRPWRSAAWRSSGNATTDEDKGAQGGATATLARTPNGG